MVCAGLTAIARQVTAGQQRCSGGHNLGQAVGGAVVPQFRWIDPARIVEFVAEHGFASQPARGKTQNDEMPFDFSLVVACDDLAMPGKRDGLDRERGLFTHLTDGRLDKRFAGFDRTARQGIEVERRLARAAHHEHFPVAENGSTDCQEWTLRVGSLVGHAGLSLHQPVDDVLRRGGIFSDGLAVDDSASARDQRLQPADGVACKSRNCLGPPVDIVHRSPGCL